MDTIVADRDVLHRLVDDLPDDEVAEAVRILEYLAGLAEHPAIRALNDAPTAPMEDDEKEIFEEACKKQAEGRARYVSHAEARRILLDTE